MERSKADKWEWLKLQNVVPICPTKLYISRRVAFFFFPNGWAVEDISLSK